MLIWFLVVILVLGNIAFVIDVLHNVIQSAQLDYASYVSGGYFAKRPDWMVFWSIPRMLAAKKATMRFFKRLLEIDVNVVPIVYV